MPRDVHRNRALSPWAKLVYAELADWVGEGSVASRGVRKIADVIGCSKNTASRAIHELELHGLITKRANSKPRKRAFYVLNSPVFGQKQGKETIVQAGPSGGKRLVSMDRSEVA